MGKNCEGAQYVTGNTGLAIHFAAQLSCYAKKLFG